ncbi:unnamed protein product [Porites evermanni]|uniref:Tesmin/TSO1-like CXC domain-containing protein n=1 Tax=Porites evermanni TaxID=104178 RepID=A0ABN8LPY8_9CNID|nr:unnamed protein product [Porites evermanni]
MEERLSLKRSVPTLSFSKCIICQETKKDVLFNATQQGLRSLKVSSEERRKLGDTANTDVIDAILEAIEGNKAEDLRWHKSCYAKYTDKGKISRLRKSFDSSKDTLSPPETATSSTLRSKASSTDWELCIFCQRGSTSKKQTLCSVTTFKMSQQILKGAKCDHDLSLRVSGVNDLIAAEGKYHPNCYKKFQRSASRSVDIAKDDSGAVLLWLVDELKTSAEHGHILELKEVWLRYCSLASENSIDIPPSFRSRMTTFKEHIAPHVADFYDFVLLRNQAIAERQTVLVPIKFSHIPVSQVLNQQTQSESRIPVFQPDERDDFLSLVHVALKIRSDILSQPSHQGLNVSREDALACVPESLYMFIRLMLGGQYLLENVSNDKKRNQENHVETRVLSIAQDLVYSVSGGRMWTPKHIGLGSSLHQATRSKKLVQMFHNAGHIISYRDIRRVDTALAKHTLSTMNTENGAVTPVNLAEGRFIHFTADNIDINEGTLDGQNTFHATQYAAWQRGPESVGILQNITPTKSTTLKVPDEVNTILPAYIREGTAEPQFKEDVKEEWFKQPIQNCPQAVQAEATDTAFFFKRQNEELKSGWTSFNEKHSDTDPEVSTVGYMPIVLAPAHDVNTLNTVVQRIMQVAESFNQKHVVLTVDQALFPLLMELKWTLPDYKDTLIPRLGGLHTSMNFLKVLGQHIQDSGLPSIWIESGILGPRTVERALAGKDYNKGTRVHKITLQAMWQLILPQVLAFIAEKDNELKQNLERSVQSNSKEEYLKLLDLLSSTRYQALLSSFITTKKDKNPNFEYWWNYMEMVRILLLFIRAQREGLWQLHLYAFHKMLPFFHRYDHTNYARWGAVYLAEMKQLPAEVQAEFDNGNWVVKGSPRRFNQVDPDQGQEWLNGTGKRGGGILLHQANIFNVNQQADVPERLQNMVTKDLTTTQIEESLLNASSLGQKKLDTFVKERLMVPKEDENRKKLRDPLPKNKALTFVSLYEAEKKEREKSAAIKADRTILQRIITAYDAGRRVDLPRILSHELVSVPLAIADTNGQLRSGNKSVLIELLSGGMEYTRVTPVTGRSTLVIDGQALVMALGRPTECNTFDDLADRFLKAVLVCGKDYDRIDVAFDRYRETSIKCATRKKPRFLSEKLLAGAPVNKIIIVSGGFQDEDTVKCSRPNIDVRALRGFHEEADTRIILHCIHSDAEFLVVACQDTDVFCLLIAHIDKMRCKQLWMKAGTSKKPKYLPIHTIRERLKNSVSKIETILPFHAITGCDTVSFFAGHSKKTAWKAFAHHQKLLESLGDGNLDDTTVKSVEKFISRVYNAANAEGCNEARAALFSRCRSPEALPPTSDAARWHIARAHFQAMVWRQAHETNPTLPLPETMGWTKSDDGKLVPKLMTLAPVPESCTEMITCGCKSGCSTNRCSCRNVRLPCTGACKCRSTGDLNCTNDVDEHVIANQGQ